MHSMHTSSAVSCSPSLTGCGGGGCTGLASPLAGAERSPPPRVPPTGAGCSGSISGDPPVPAGVTGVRTAGLTGEAALWNRATARLIMSPQRAQWQHSAPSGRLCARTPAACSTARALLRRRMWSTNTRWAAPSGVPLAGLGSLASARGGICLESRYWKGMMAGRLRVRYLFRASAAYRNHSTMPKLVASPMQKPLLKPEW
mmetsp:Transcript_18846/g.56940  ORF Transcript_18846/g.56940 Transcript_18846/m.56940 type:complete len:201 (-) Transcript_18846:175-777(-)